jgi:hypothetical protein
MKKWYARRRARRLLAEFAPEEAAQVLRLVIGAEVEIDPAIMLMLVERAIEGSTGPGRRSCSSTPKRTEPAAE